MAEVDSGQIDQLLDQLDVALQKVRDLKDSKVKLPAAEINLLTILGKLRDLMNSSMAGSKEALSTTFGGDCHRVARIIVVLDALELSPMNASDARLEGCRNACGSMKDVLNDMGSRDALLKAAEEEKERLKKKYEPKGKLDTAPADSLPETKPAASDETPPSSSPETKPATSDEAPPGSSPETKPAASDDSKVGVESLPDSKPLDESKADPPASDAAMIEVKRETTDAKWGIGLVGDTEADKSGAVLLVKSIDAGGVIDMYNQSNPDRKIVIGDRITGINGESGDQVKMISFLRDALILKLVIIKATDGRTDDAPVVPARRAAVSSYNPLHDAADPDYAPPEGAVIDPEWAILIGVQLCKLGCGRRCMPGVTKRGNPFDTCCRGCALGEAHDKRCGQVDAKKVGAGMCKFGCGRRSAPGKDASGQPLDTCCRGCAMGGDHDEYCQKGTGIEAAPVLVIDERDIFVEAKKRLPPVSFNRFIQEIRSLNRGDQTVEETIKKTQDIFGVGLCRLHAQVSELLIREVEKKKAMAKPKVAPSSGGYMSSFFS